jgi:hypothetical protein
MLREGESKGSAQLGRKSRGNDPKKVDPHSKGVHGIVTVLKENEITQQVPDKLRTPNRYILYCIIFPASPKDDTSSGETT